MVLTSVVSNPLLPHGPQAARLLCRWDFPGEITEVDRYVLLQGIFPTQGSNSLGSPALAGGFFTTSATWEALNTVLPVYNSLCRYNHTYMLKNIFTKKQYQVWRQ